MSNSKYQKWLNKLAIIASVLLLGVGLAFAIDALSAMIGDSGPRDLKRDAMFQGAATIAGLAIFGSAIGIRIYRKPETRNAKWWAGLFTYMGITALVGTQGYIMMYACCMDISNPVTFKLIFITITQLMVIGAFLVIASSRKDGGERVFESIRKELETIREIVSTPNTKAKHDNQEVEYVHSYIGHDIYDSLLATGHIRYIKYDVQQEIQGIIRTTKRHNECLKQIERMVVKGYKDGYTNKERDVVFMYQKYMQSYEERIAGDISTLLDKL